MPESNIRVLETEIQTVKEDIKEIKDDQKTLINTLSGIERMQEQITNLYRMHDEFRHDVNEKFSLINVKCEDLSKVSIYNKAMLAAVTTALGWILRGMLL